MVIILENPSALEKSMLAPVTGFEYDFKNPMYVVDPLAVLVSTSILSPDEME